MVPMDLPEADATKFTGETEGIESFTCAATGDESQDRAVGDLPESGGTHHRPLQLTVISVVFEFPGKLRQC